MKPANVMRGLSDTQLWALIESLPEGMALLDGSGHTLWANRLARHVWGLRTTTSPDDRVGIPLGALIERFIDAMPPVGGDAHARWTVDAGTVEVTLRRIWASQVAVRLSPPPDMAGTDCADDAAARPSAWQLILAERQLEEAVLGVVVANPAGRIEWMNPQAQRLLGGAHKRAGCDAKRNVARAARHVANGRLRAPIRMRVELAARAVEARFWSVGPGLAGVLFDDEEEARAAVRLIA